MSPFLDILYKLSHICGVKLYPDKNNVCRVVIDDDIAIQLEVDTNQEKLFLGAEICEIPPGKFREEVLKHAMASNFNLDKEIGILSYRQKSNALSIFDYLPLKNLTGEFLLDYMSVFSEKIAKWQESIASGRPGPDNIDGDSKDKPPMFGIKT